MHDQAEEIETQGYALIPGLLAPAECDALAAAIGSHAGPGRRGLLALPEVTALARSAKMLELVRSIVAGKPRPVRAILFDKSPPANWPVPWHQDLTIAVRERIEAPGFNAWSVKEGIPHVHPPAAVLEQMLAVRLHFDSTDVSNGALRVLPGTHRSGRLSDEQISRLAGDRGEVAVAAACGDALLLRPLLLHASSRAITPTRRRVLHIEYATCDLPAGLDWHPAA